MTQRFFRLFQKHKIRPTNQIKINYIINDDDSNLCDKQKKIKRKEGKIKKRRLNQEKTSF